MNGSRLIYIYLITILVSGGIMVYLSIQNSSNFRELTKKRILEEEKGVHEAYSLAFQKSVEQLTIDLMEFLSKDDNSESQDFFNGIVSDHFIMKEDGTLVRPLFSVQRYTPSTQRNNSTFSTSFQQGEKLEFLGNNNSATQRSYLRALKQASGTHDSVQVYNALSRLQVKMGRHEQALDYFEIIINDFCNSLNNFGLAYPYFSADQLLRINDPELRSRKKELLGKFLLNLNSGQIPFAQNTGDLLESLKAISGSAAETETDHSFNENLEIAIQTSGLIENYRQLLLDLMNDNETKTFTAVNDFMVFSSENGSHEIFMTASTAGFIHGFVIPLMAIDQKSRAYLPKNSFSFEYLINLGDQNTENQKSGSKYEIRDRFSSFFPNHVLTISVLDEKHITDFIFQRSLITIIGLALLLAAMIIGFVMLVSDVARKKNIEKLRADFVANVTHELKTPLTSINMFADSILLDRVKNKEGLKKYAQIIVKESEKLKRMINNILEFSRQENDKMHYVLKEEQVAHLIHEIMEEMNYWLSLHKFDLDLDLDEELYIHTDAEGFKQVMSNLITNAIKYSPDDKRIAIRNYKNNGRVCVDVEDHGIGITSDKIDSIFKKFYRISDDGNDSASGTGLGLTVSKEIIEAMQGTLTVKSKINEGSTFTIQFNEEKRS